MFLRSVTSQSCYNFFLELETLVHQSDFTEQQMLIEFNKNFNTLTIQTQNGDRVTLKLGNQIDE